MIRAKSRISKVALRGLVALSLTVGMAPVAGIHAYAAEGHDQIVQDASIESKLADDVVYADPADYLVGGMTINKNGEYALSPEASGNIVIQPGIIATIVGSFNGDYSKGASADVGCNVDLSFTVGNNASITVKNLGISQSKAFFTSDSTTTRTFDFLGKATFNIEGKNFIEANESDSADYFPAVFHVGPSADVTFGGSGTLYGFKGLLSAFIGSDAWALEASASKRENNGNITFVSGNWFLKSSKTGPAIGCDSSTGTNGDIRFRGGNIYVVTKAKGAAIGASNQGKAGNIYMEGATVQAGTSFSGSCVGKGGSGTAAYAGTLIYKTGTLLPVINSNAINQLTGADKLTYNLDGYAISPIGITSKIVNESNQSLAMLEIGIKDVIGSPYKVYIDGKEIFSGNGSYPYSYIANNIGGNNTYATWKSYAGTSLYAFATQTSHTVKITVDGETYTQYFGWNGSSFYKSTTPVSTSIAMTSANTKASLSANALTYNGSVQKPTVSSLTVNGKAVASSNYSLTYLNASKVAANPVNAGSYYVRITGKGSYTGSIDIPFQINPAQIVSAALSATTLAYSGGEKKPAVTVNASIGGSVKAIARGAMTSTSDFDITYPSSMKNVGAYQVLITGKGNYTGTTTMSFKINPKATKITKLTASKRGFTAKWTKVKTQNTGYQLRYSLKKTMKSSKTITVKKATTITKKKTGLKAKKKYYVQIRTYKTVGKVKYYSAWSTAKSVTTKK